MSLLFYARSRRQCLYCTKNRGKRGQGMVFWDCHITVYKALSGYVHSLGEMILYCHPTPSTLTNCMNFKIIYKNNFSSFPEFKKLFQQSQFSFWSTLFISPTPMSICHYFYRMEHKDIFRIYINGCPLTTQSQF